MNQYILDSNHNIVIETDPIVHENFMRNIELRRVKKDQIDDSYVSTVFLGFDHQWRDGPPLLFETMVFDGPLNEELKRCSTWIEALLMHDEMVSKVRSCYAEGKK